MLSPLADARAKLAADPKNIELMVALSKAQAARRLYREAVATDTAGQGWNSFGFIGAEIELKRLK